MHNENTQSLSLVNELFKLNFQRAPENISIQAQKFKCDKKADSDSKGSARIEILYNTIATEKAREKIIVYGLVENTDNQQVPFTLCYETQWLNEEYIKTRTSLNHETGGEFLILDFDKDTRILSGADFDISIKNEDDGQAICKASGYLRFERGEQLIQ